MERENTDPAVLAEIETLDAKLRANAGYLINELELYEHIWRNEPDGPLESRETIRETWAPVEAAPVAMAAEEHAPYEAQSQDE